MGLGGWGVGFGVPKLFHCRFPCALEEPLGLLKCLVFFKSSPTFHLFWMCFPRVFCVFPGEVTLGHPLPVPQFPWPWGGTLGMPCATGWCPQRSPAGCRNPKDREEPGFPGEPAPPWSGAAKSQPRGGEIAAELTRSRHPGLLQSLPFGETPSPKTNAEPRAPQPSPSSTAGSGRGFGEDF